MKKTYQNQQKTKNIDDIICNKWTFVTFPSYVYNYHFSFSSIMEWKEKKFIINKYDPFFYNISIYCWNNIQTIYTKHCFSPTYICRFRNIIQKINKNHIIYIKMFTLKFQFYDLLHSWYEQKLEMILKG
jgi:hypothetical protein